MSQIEEHIASLHGKLQQLLKRYNSLQKENKDIQSELSAIKQREQNYKASINTLEEKVSILKAASGKLEGDDKKDFDKKLGQYIKDIDKCITLLSK